MTVAQKFLFDRIFDLPGTLPGPDAPGIDPETGNNAAADAASEEEALATYTESDLADARDAGFSAGREEGRREGLEGQEKVIANALNTIAERLNDLLRVEDEHHATTERQALAVMTAAARKVLPDLSRRGALGEIEHLTRDLLERLRHESRVTVRVHPDLVDALTSRFDHFTSELTAGNELSVRGDAQIAHGDCRLEWGGGGAERRVETLLNEMDAIISRNLDGPDSVSTAPTASTGTEDEATAPAPPRETETPEVSELHQAQEAITRLSETRASQTEGTRSSEPERESAAGPDEGVETEPASPFPDGQARPSEV